MWLNQTCSLNDNLFYWRDCMIRTKILENSRLSNMRFAFRHVWHILPLLLLVPIAHSRAQTWSVTSPGGGLVIQVKQDSIATIYPHKYNCYYRTLLNNAVTLDWSPLGVFVTGQDFVTNLTFVNEKDSSVNETYTLSSGKKSLYTNNCKEMKLIFRDSSSRQIAFYFHAYDDAAAYCYELLGSGSAQITGEASGFTFDAGATGWCHTNPSLGDEQTYNKFNVGTDSTAANFLFPMLFKTPTNVWVLITEAAVYGAYTGTSISSPFSSKYVFKTLFPSSQTSVSGTLPWKLPWRVAIMGSTLGPIVESVVIENLNPSCTTDVSWVKSGRSAWSWLTQETGDTTQQKLYIDFANQMGWEYNLIDWNFTKSQVTGICNYATARNVGNELWFNYSEVTTQAKQDSLFSLCHTWGLKGVKIDFIYDNGSQTLSYYQNMMKWFDMTESNLLKYKLMATFHGCTIPRGQRRRWPNVMTWEAVLGYEWIGRGYPGTWHNCMLPYTRNVIGPMDMTPVLFTLGQMTNGLGSARTSTDAHELALSVIMESGIQHFADKPAGYNSCIGKSFLQTVPSAWDDIRFIDGYPGESAILARRKDNDWYIAGISALAAKTMSVSLSFLKAGSYTVDLYKDSSGTQRTMTKQTVTINPSTPMSIWVNANGGFCCKIPNSYETVSNMPESGNAVGARKHNKVDRLSLYHLVRGATDGRSLRNADRVIDIRGKTIVSRDSRRLPQGVFITVQSK
ncbi:MAG TPA: hypothetical protein DCO75_06570 [Fibrobacteres bacterium]|nr:hypothetical protein [Fibrobacterota bacterium]